jgi:hypothetical protein
VGSQSLSPLSAQTLSQPRQSHCSDEAVGDSATDSEHTLDQVVRQRSAEPPVTAVQSVLCEVAVRWYGYLRLARTELGRRA